MATTANYFQIDRCKRNYINGLIPYSKISEWEEGYTLIDGDSDNGTIQCPLLSEWLGGFVELGNPSEPLLAEAIAQITGVSRVKTTKKVKSIRAVAKVPKVTHKEYLQRTIIDQNKFDNLTNTK